MDLAPLVAWQLMTPSALSDLDRRRSGMDVAPSTMPWFSMDLNKNKIMLAKDRLAELMLVEP